MRVRLFAVVVATLIPVLGCTGQPPPDPIIALAAGGNHSCVVRGSGTMSCWGDNIAGSLGNGTTTGSSVPVGVVGITDATAAAVSAYQSCALHADGRVSCWGYNAQGQLGNGTTTDSSVPVPVTGITTATGIAIGTTHSCALLASGGVSCWGYNVNGELGNGSTVSSSSVPVPVTGITSATALAANAFHSCAVLADGGMSCWGANNWGQLGNGTFSLFSNVPVPVTAVTTATGVAVGLFHSCAILNGGEASCWGQGGYGQLGNSARPSYSTLPVPVAGLTDVTALTAGDRHSCARGGTGTMSCWGSNSDGQLGTGTTNESILPIAVPGVGGATHIAAGTGHTCAVLNDQTATCWGDGRFGQLGDGTTTSSNVPVLVTGLP